MPLKGSLWTSFAQQNQFVRMGMMWEAGNDGATSVSFQLISCAQRAQFSGRRQLNKTIKNQYIIFSIESAALLVGCLQQHAQNQLPVKYIRLPNIPQWNDGWHYCQEGRREYGSALGGNHFVLCWQCIIHYYSVGKSPVKRFYSPLLHRPLFLSLFILESTFVMRMMTIVMILTGNLRLSEFKGLCKKPCRSESQTRKTKFKSVSEIVYAKLGVQLVFSEVWRVTFKRLKSRLNQKVPFEIHLTFVRLSVQK